MGRPVREFIMFSNAIFFDLHLLHQAQKEGNKIPISHVHRLDTPPRVVKNLALLHVRNFVVGEEFVVREIVEGWRILLLKMI